MCGFAAPTIDDLRLQAAASPDLVEVQEMDRFDSYFFERTLSVLTFSRPTEAAHPSVVCRVIRPVGASQSQIDFSMRCDAGRDDCDALFLEFQALDGRTFGGGG